MSRQAIKTTIADDEKVFDNGKFYDAELCAGVFSNQTKSIKRDLLMFRDRSTGEMFSVWLKPETLIKFALDTLEKHGIETN